MSKCNLIAWVDKDPALLVVKSAGFYSETPETIEHDLHGTCPVLIDSVEGASYSEALEKMRSYIRTRLDTEKKMGINSVRGGIYKLALLNELNGGFL